MDLHVVAPLASPAERAAVDSVLAPVIGPARSGWQGGVRDPAIDGHVAHGGHEARAHRDLLLPALHAIQARIGYISQPALAYVCRRLTVPPAEAYGVATFYALLATTPRPPAVAHVCDDIACRLAGAEELCSTLERRLGPAGEPALDGRATWLRSPCLGQCERAPAALFTIAGEAPRTFAVASVDAVGIVGQLEDATTRVTDEGPGGRPGAGPPDDARTRVTDGGQGGGLAAPSPERLAAIRASVPQAGDDDLRLLARVGRVDPTSLDDYRAHGGYRALARAFELGPARVNEEVTASKLVGRGGAAFPTGRKWAGVLAQPTRPHYLVCNADESEPGTFKDRALLEEDPFALVEAMTIAGFASGAEKGYLYLRGEYPLAEARLANAIARAREAGLLGPDVLGSGVAFDIDLRRGAGAYICGEETALFESIEGKRGEPRNKPPFPVEVGLFGAPTTVNNVETLANVPAIVLEGGAAFAAIGTEGSTGPKLFCLSGHVARPGVYEVPVRGDPARAARARRRRPRRPGDPGDPARRRGRRVRRPGRARHAAHVRGDAGDRGDPRIGRRDGLRRDGRPRRRPPPDRRVLPRRVVRPVRPVPGRLGPPGGDPRPAGRRSPQRLRPPTSSPSCATSGGRCATRRSAGSARPPRARSRAPSASRGW